MTTLEDRLREALTERAALSPVDPHAWDKVVARSRRRRFPRFRWPWPARTGLLVPVAAAAAVAAVIVATTTLAGHVSSASKPLGPASASPSGEIRNPRLTAFSGEKRSASEPTCR